VGEFIFRKEEKRMMSHIKKTFIFLSNLTIELTLLIFFMILQLSIILMFKTKVYYSQVVL